MREELLDLLWADIRDEDEFPNVRPLLAHYTSAYTLDSIFSSGQLWLSHPMLMNDIEELRWGIEAGVRVLASHVGIERACGSSERFELFKQYFAEYVHAQGVSDAYSIFAACFCEHEAGDSDGLLSMWRAYGANGGGAAIVFDTSKLIPRDDSPFILSRVSYGSGADREAWIANKLDQVADFIESLRRPLAQDELAEIAFSLLARVKIFALTTKHVGFREEKEWRLIYLPERDVGRKFVEFINYVVGESGFQPKMKLALGSDMLGGVSLSDLVDKVMLGPTHEGALGVAALRRMLVLTGHEKLTARVVQSTTPFRPT